MDVTKKRCSFCGEPGSKDNILSGGLGAFICAPCARYKDEFFSDDTPDRSHPAWQPPWLTMSNTEIVAVIPQIARTAAQAEDFLVEWIELARGRGVSWAEIGKSLGVSRQAAWQRFAHRVDQGAPHIPRARSGA